MTQHLTALCELQLTAVSVSLGLMPMASHLCADGVSTDLAKTAECSSAAVRAFLVSHKSVVSHNSVEQLSHKSVEQLSHKSVQQLSRKSIEQLSHKSVE